MIAKNNQRAPQDIPAEDRQVQERLEGLRKEYEKLHKKKIETDTTLQNLEQQLRELERQAKDEYGTSDLNELRALLERWRAENEEKVAEYQEHIRSIQGALERIENPEEAE
ncbi:hypothetical protein SAMN02746041_01301 [Desulfacinum hydrothermale DSM 13146]|uniref:Uncharacterized protein n=1 Tax=Desulfacinum hydrothermale DSM 13146 TaxID=1121390 RepID=A0A1W1XDB1_9BACT|nr:hypothetical protein [Desulfacinum hydrothermale]SMC21877.1 hypothetical protein SAMN02746041_01301 [Desulfacinum hydrothermale DSM 13146]